MRIDSYDDQLLHLAVDLAQRLLPAFDTPTGSQLRPSISILEWNMLCITSVHQTCDPSIYNNSFCKITISTA